MRVESGEWRVEIWKFEIRMMKGEALLPPRN